MWLTDDEQRALLESSTKITEKISKAVQQAMKALGLGAVPEEIEKIWKVAEKMDKRQEAIIKAELRSLSARAATFKSNIED